MMTPTVSGFGRGHAWPARAIVVVLLGGLVPLAGCSATAHREDPGAMRDEVGELQRTVDDLNAKVKDLERRLEERPQPAATAGAEGPAATTAAAAGMSSRELWEKVESGMPRAEVERLLGPPTRQLEMTSRTLWYYQYANVGSGSVVFAEDSVIDWRAPPFGGWAWW